MNESKDFIEILKNRISIVDVISKKTKLTKRGHDYFGLCPFHHEKTGSFKVSPSRGMYYCFGCSAHGDVFNFVMSSENMVFHEAVKYLADLANMQVPKIAKQHDETSSIFDVMNYINQYFHDNSTADDVSDYLKCRGITEDDINKFYIGYADSSHNLYESLIKNGFKPDLISKTGVFYGNKNKFVNRIIFPILNSSGKCIGFGGRAMKGENPKYLNSPETSIFKKSENLYGYNLAKNGSYNKLILVEGYIDVIAMHRAGFDRTVACLGTTISEHQIDLCWRLCDSPIILLDGDDAGMKASHRWLLRILPKLIPGKTFSFAIIPNKMDPDMAIKHGGKEYISQIIDTSAQLRDWLWSSSFGMHSVTNPEQIAFVLKFIEDSINTIKDDTIKMLYKKWFSEKKRDFIFNNNKKYKKLNCNSGYEKITPQAVSNKMKKYQEILLATIVNHPNILDRVVEEFAQINFQDAWYSWVQEEIVKEYSEKNSIVEVSKKIYNEGCAFLKRAEIHAPFVSCSFSDDESLNGWLDIFSDYVSMPVAKQDLESAAGNLEKKVSIDSWNRFRAIKNAFLLDDKNDRG